MSTGGLSREVGRYDLFDAIASGGMATVHFGRMRGAVGFQRVVAIKRLHPHYAHDESFLEMFLDEARLASRLKHPNVVQTLDVVVDGSEVLLVMELVLGESLEALTPKAAARVVPLSVASAIVCNVLEGLHSAHEATSDTGEPLAIVHRDVSPSNVLVGEDGVARLFDFGIAKAAINTQETRDGVVKGKVTYMAPEQVRGVVDRRADLYATGVILWELMTGRRRFVGEKNDALFLKLATSALDPLVPASRLRVDLPAAFDEIIATATASDPSRRFGSAREMAMAIESVVRPAPAREVAEWVKSAAGARIAFMAESVKRIEGDSARSPHTGTMLLTPRTLTGAGLASSVPPSVTAGTQTTGLGPRVKRNFTMPAALVAFTAVLLLVGLRAFAVRAGVVHESARADGAASPSAQPAPDPISLATAVPTSVPVVEPAVVAAPTVTAPPVVPPRISAYQPPSHATAAVVTAVPTTEPRSKPACDNPFLVGADGIRQVKPECM